MIRAPRPPRRTKIYGSAITFYEEYSEEELTEEQREGLHLNKYRAKSERQGCNSIEFALNFGLETGTSPVLGH